MNQNKNKIDQWNDDHRDADAVEILRWAAKEFGAKIKFASSLGLEDQVITDMIAKFAPEIPIFTLDTGRLFQETYDLIQETERKYDIKVSIFFPNTDDVQNMVATYGVNLFYNSIELRKMCCHTRKVEPLNRAFSGLDSWVCGLRKDQAVSRVDVEKIQWDAANSLVKVNPLCDWSEDDLWQYIKAHDVPYNKLHDQGFPSIGCASCTRAIKDGEDIRAGRWWWELPEQKECGLHVVDGKMVRKMSD